MHSLKKNFEEFQHYVLSELNFRFTIIDVTETRICHRECSLNFLPELPGYCFESVPTPLSAVGVGLFIDQNIVSRGGLLRKAGELQRASLLFMLLR